MLLDTNAYVAVVSGHVEAREIVDRAWSVAVSSIVIGELLAGFEAGVRLSENLRALRDFLRATNVLVLDVSRSTAEHYGRIYKLLRDTGHPIPQNDLWIAASALEHSLALFTYDRHFDCVPGLRRGSTVGELRMNAPEA